MLNTKAVRVLVLYNVTVTRDVREALKMMRQGCVCAWRDKEYLLGKLLGEKGIIKVV